MRYKNQSSERTLVIRLFELIVCLYIIFVPVINSLVVTILGYGVQIYISVLIIMLALVAKFLIPQRMMFLYEQMVGEKKFALKLFEIILCLYVILVPVINSIDFWVFGYGVQVYLSILIILLALILNFFSPKMNQNNYFNTSVLMVFVLVLLVHMIQNRYPDTSYFLLIMLYVSFLSLPKQISLKKIYYSYHMSTIVAAIYTISAGITGGGVARTATSVDGSIGLLGLTICLFLNEKFEKTNNYKILKFGALLSSLIVLGFGMSRARLALGAFIVGIKCLLIVSRIVSTGKVKLSVIFAFPFIVAAIIFVLSLDVTQNLIAEIFLRFNDGFESLGRTDEVQFGFSLFKQHCIFGAGFEVLRFKDYLGYTSIYHNHCMYVAILARGGILLAVAFFLSFLSIIKDTLRTRNLFLCLVMFLFFVLGYGNAGVFNYTIVGFLIPLVVELKNYTLSERVDTFNERNIYIKR